MLPTNHACVHETVSSGVPIHCWRWYFTNRSLPWASENGRRFHYWIQLLKDGHFPAEQLFASVYRHLWSTVLGKPQAIVTVPPSKQFKIRPEYPLSRCADIAAGMGAGVHLRHHLRRIESLPSCVSDNSSRDFLKQRASMRVESDVEDDTESIVIIDDVRTSGSTLAAAIELVRQHHPQARINALTFGQTQRTGSTPFPEIPSFPESRAVSSEQIEQFMQ